MHQQQGSECCLEEVWAGLGLPMDEWVNRKTENLSGAYI